MISIIKAYATKNLCYIASQKMKPQGIVVHSTGADNPYLKRYVDAPKEVGVNQYGNHWNTAMPNGRKVCVHSFIGYDKNDEVKIANILPYNICCWGVGNGKKGSYNYNPAYIQFEICEDGLTDKIYYKKAFSAAAEYCAELCKNYGIEVSNIVGHCEAYRLGYGSNHSDPEHWMKNFGQTMADFRARVSEILNSSSIEADNISDNSSEINLIKKGDLVSIADNASYYDGAAVPLWVRTQNWYVKSEPIGNRAIIDKNEKGTNSICSPISTDFLRIIKKKSDNIVKSDVTGKCPYLIKVTANCAYIYKDAGIDTEKVGAITDNGVYTIVKEQYENGGTKWGRLKSGAGWILLDCAEKI